MAASSTILGSDQENGPVYFWREFEEPHGYLSQWYECSFEHQGTTYRSTEMWMMVQKAVLFGDEEVAQAIREATTPGEMKALGRKAKGFDRKKWDEHKSRIVEEGNWWKFTVSKEKHQIKEALLATGDREIVEASPEDRIWGIGFHAANAHENRAEWGENLLGLALMNVRRRIREQESHL
ncbi:DUF1768-domain-containing protein [Rhizodiscina lignyota]|uniref:DUF1768-domain-containing protein n=1 Tax=Rhizodiscina lignyota TaxID=1504668 RepID=A0A9P4IDX6_9PEZI|nr:DUF1768-domain-containing protein [Rhizodiscina lignyota]